MHIHDSVMWRLLRDGHGGVVICLFMGGGGGGAPPRKDLNEEG